MEGEQGPFIAQNKDTCPIVVFGDTLVEAVKTVSRNLSEPDPGNSLHD